MMRRVLFFSFLVSALSLTAGEDLKHGPDSEYHEGVPKGKVEKQPQWESKIFSGTKRDWWIYVPAQYDAAKPANVMVFQDGAGPVSEKGEMRAPVVFDNLIHKKEMPVTIGIFLNPGVLAAAGQGLPRQNRSFEYDSVGDRYARFLLEEILPEVEKKYKLTTDPAGRAICGQSSGGSCAFTVAWERPDAFGKVVSGIGSFTSLHGCNAYPELIRKTEPKPIRIYMQGGETDLDIYAGSWWHANVSMAAAFRWSGYDYFFLQGKGGHNGKQLGANFPDAMRWLWRDAPVAGTRPKGVDPRGVFEVLVKDEGWKKVAALQSAESFPFRAASDDEGALCFLEFNSTGTGTIRKLSPDGKVSDYSPTRAAFQNLAFLPNGKLLVTTAREIFVAGPDGALESKAKTENDISAVFVNHRGEVYCELPREKKMRVFDSAFKSRDLEYDGEMDMAFCVTPDQGFLIAAHHKKWQLSSRRIESDGTLTHEEPFYTLQGLEGLEYPYVSALAVDEKGRLYASSTIGVQIFDQGGRVIGILTLPDREKIQGMAFGGPNLDSLYVTTSKGIYARKLNAKGVRSNKPPVMPPPPRM